MGGRRWRFLAPQRSTLHPPLSADPAHRTGLPAELTDGLDPSGRSTGEDKPVPRIVWMVRMYIGGTWAFGGKSGSGMQPEDRHLTTGTFCRCVFSSAQRNRRDWCADAGEDCIVLDKPSQPVCKCRPQPQQYLRYIDILSSPASPHSANPPSAPSTRRRAVTRAFPPSCCSGARRTAMSFAEVPEALSAHMCNYVYIYALHLDGPNPRRPLQVSISTPPSSAHASNE